MPTDEDRPNDAVAQHLAERLRQLRAQRGLTQEAVAYASGLTRNHYQLLERGTTQDGRPSNPRLSTLIALAKALDTSLEDLIN